MYYNMFYHSRRYLNTVVQRVQDRVGGRRRGCSDGGCQGCGGRWGGVGHFKRQPPLGHSIIFVLEATAAGNVSVAPERNELPDGPFASCFRP